jgi:RNA recognition motif-containing protein
MAFKIYVGRLSYQTTEDELKDLFSQHGAVESAVIITDKFSGQSKGFGFVEMTNEEEGRAAIKATDNTEFGGRTIAVSEARPKEDRPSNGGGFRGGNDRRGGGGGGYGQNRY